MVNLIYGSATNTDCCTHAVDTVLSIRKGYCRAAECGAGHMDIDRWPFCIVMYSVHLERSADG